MLDWWMMVGKREDCRNGKGNEIKIQSCHKLSTDMKVTGTVKDLSTGDILNEIQSFEISCGVASDFAHNAGKGLKRHMGWLHLKS